MSFTKTASMKRMLLAGLAPVALLVAACGGSSSSSSHLASAPSTSTNTASTPATTAASTAPATATTLPASTTSTNPASGGAAASAAPPCRAAELSLSFLGGQGATGHGELGFALRNTGQQTCSTVGYPGVQFLDKTGQPLATVPSHTTQDFFGSVPEVALAVAPGASVSFRLGVTHGAASASGCTTAYGLAVIPPNDTASVRTTIPTGAFECRTATVSPLAQGTSAYS